MLAEKTLTVGELVAVLKNLDPTAPVLGTWEGILTSVHAIFRDNADGRIILDVENEFYRLEDKDVPPTWVWLARTPMDF